MKFSPLAFYIIIWEFKGLSQVHLMQPVLPPKLKEKLESFEWSFEYLGLISKQVDILNQIFKSYFYNQIFKSMYLFISEWV